MSRRLTQDLSGEQVYIMNGITSLADQAGTVITTNQQFPIGGLSNVDPEYPFLGLTGASPDTGPSPDATVQAWNAIGDWAEMTASLNRATHEGTCTACMHDAR